MASTEAVEAAREYRTTLEELVSNNKMQINLLTILAEDYAAYAGEIVKTIQKRIMEANKQEKLLTLYVIDSILKNVGGAYKDLIGKVIVEVFVHVFLNSDEKVRASLYKLRQTWTGIFLPSLLYRLDVKVKEEDHAWPITAPTRLQAQTSASGAAAPTTSASKSAQPPKPSSAANGSNSATRVHVNPKFIGSSDTSRDPRAARRAAPEAPKSAPPTKVAKKDEAPAKTAPIDPRKATTSQSSTSAEKIDVLDEILSLPDSRPVKEEPVEEPIPPVPVKTAPPADVKPVVNRGFEKEKRFRQGQHSPRDRDFRFQKHGPPRPKRTNTPPVAANVHEKTAQPGAHAFSAPVLAHVGSAPAAQQPSAPIPVSAPSFQPPRLQENLPPAAAPSPFVPPPTQNFRPPTAQAPSFAPPPSKYPISTPVPMPQVKTEISHDTVRLDIPANNKIFVDGKAHEVMYIDDTAVIERNGLPHRIYFAGAPRSVIIDGQAHPMQFGERKTIYIDGQPHVMRFGAPSRELYMGDFPFKGQFGGAPIVATINGVRHEIRLSGPAPEVKIEPEPSYDLARFLPQVREGRPAEQNPFELLRRLKESGFLNKKQQPQHEEKPKRPFHPIQHHRHPNVSPIPSEHTYESILKQLRSVKNIRFDSVERRSAPTTSLKDFNMRLLKIRYDAIIDRLHEKQKDACPLCGLRMEQRGERYNKHMDWHVQRNLQLLERTSCSRSWYSSRKEWLKSEDEQATTSSSAHDQKIKSEPTVQAIESSLAETKECAVCGETFEEFFDGDEDDAWKLRNCILVRGRPFHPQCAQDESVLEPHEESVSDLECFVSVDNKPLKQDIDPSMFH